MLLLFLACTDPRVDQLETRLATVEAELARVQSAHTADSKPVARDDATGEIVPVHDAAGVASCAFDTLQGLATAELAHDAAFDAFSEDFERIGWVISSTRGCHRYLAVRVSLQDDERGRTVNFLAEAVVTRGDERGRSFQTDKHAKVSEVQRRSEAEVVAFTTGSGWTGAAN